MLFHSYEIYNNGIFFYEEMFKELKKFYFNEKRFNFLNEFFNKIKKDLNIQLRLSDMKKMFNTSNHPYSIDNLYLEEKILNEYNEIVDSFQFILVKKIKLIIFNFLGFK